MTIGHTPVRPERATSAWNPSATRPIGNASATIAPMARGAVGDPFEALGDPHRRELVEMLRAGDRSVQELADAMPISRPAVSRHLKLLKQAGLVIDRAEGTRRLYRLDDEGLEEVRVYLERVWGEAAARFRMAASSTTPRRPTRR